MYVALVEVGLYASSRPRTCGERDLTEQTIRLPRPSEEQLKEEQTVLRELPQQT